MKNGLVNFYIVQLNHFLISKYIFINVKIYIYFTKFRVIYLSYDSMHLDDTRGGLDDRCHHRATSMIIYMAKM